jgi:hypothetical protein
VDYVSLRSDARDLAIGRNKMLEEATKAYLLYALYTVVEKKFSEFSFYDIVALRLWRNHYQWKVNG